MGMDEELARLSRARWEVSDAGMNGVTAPSWVAKDRTNDRPVTSHACRTGDLEDVDLNRKLAMDDSQLDETRDFHGKELVRKLEERRDSGELIKVSRNPGYTEATRDAAARAFQALELRAAGKTTADALGARSTTRPQEVRGRITTS